MLNLAVAWNFFGYTFGFTFLYNFTASKYEKGASSQSQNQAFGRQPRSKMYASTQMDAFGQVSGIGRKIVSKTDGW